MGLLRRGLLVRNRVLSVDGREEFVLRWVGIKAHHLAIAWSLLLSRRRGIAVSRNNCCDSPMLNQVVHLGMRRRIWHG